MCMFCGISHDGQSRKDSCVTLSSHVIVHVTMPEPIIRDFSALSVQQIVTNPSVKPRRYYSDRKSKNQKVVSLLCLSAWVVAVRAPSMLRQVESHHVTCRMRSAHSQHWRGGWRKNPFWMPRLVWIVSSRVVRGNMHEIIHFHFLCGLKLCQSVHEKKKEFGFKCRLFFLCADTNKQLGTP